MDLCERTVQGLGQAGQYAGDRQQDAQNDRQHVDAEIAAGIIAAVDVRAADGVDDQEDPAQERQGVENAEAKLAPRRQGAVRLRQVLQFKFVHVSSFFLTNAPCRSAARRPAGTRPRAAPARL